MCFWLFEIFERTKDSFVSVETAGWCSSMDCGLINKNIKVFLTAVLAGSCFHEYRSENVLIAKQTTKKFAIRNCFCIWNNTANQDKLRGKYLIRIPPKLDCHAKIRSEPWIDLFASLNNLQFCLPKWFSDGMRFVRVFLTPVKNQYLIQSSMQSRPLVCLSVNDSPKINDSPRAKIWRNENSAEHN